MAANCANVWTRTITSPFCICPRAAHSMSKSPICSPRPLVVSLSTTIYKSDSLPRDVSPHNRNPTLRNYSILPCRTDNVDVWWVIIVNEFSKKVYTLDNLSKIDIEWRDAGSQKCRVMRTQSSRSLLVAVYCSAIERRTWVTWMQCLIQYMSDV